MRFLLVALMSICIQKLVAQQQVRVLSFEHALRWASENNFPNYFNDPSVKDSVFKNVTSALKIYLKADTVLFPSEIKYRVISFFGKAKNPKPNFNEASSDYQVALLSSISRATVGFAIEWDVNIKIYQGNKTLLDKDIQHEIEYFSSSGYFTSVPWFTKAEFTNYFSEAIDEILGLKPAMPEKITVGSASIFEKGINQSIPNSKKILLKTDGNWKGGSRFLLALQQGTDTVSSILYNEGFDVSWPKLNLSSFTANFFSDITGLDIGYTTRSKIVRRGKLKTNTGDLLRLRLEWFELTQEYTKSTDIYIQKLGPMVAELYKDDNLQGKFTYYRSADSLQNKMKEINPVTLNNSGIHFVFGSMPGHTVKLKYDNSKSIITLDDNGKMKAAVLMLNINPDSRESSNQKLSKKKKVITSGSPGKLSEENASEWYYFYYDPSVSEANLNLYLQSLVCLLAGIGKE